jgi:hypothetical protein
LAEYQRICDCIENVEFASRKLNPPKRAPRRAATGGYLCRTVCQDEGGLVRLDVDPMRLRKMRAHYVAAGLVVETRNVPFSVDINITKVEVSQGADSQALSKPPRDVTNRLMCAFM